MSTQPIRQGVPSKNYGHLGVYFLSTGPDPRGAAPGDRLKVVIYNREGTIIRRLEEIKGEYIDTGYVDYFNSPQSRPSVQEYHIVDIDEKGNQQILLTHSSPFKAQTWFKINFPIWAQKYGVPETQP